MIQFIIKRQNYNNSYFLAGFFGLSAKKQ